MSQLPAVIHTFPLGARAELRVTLDTFNGQPRLDLRTWCDYPSAGGETRGPTKKGVSVPLSQVPDLIAALGQGLDCAGSFGLLAKGGA
jgi:hypothetical protein